MESHLIITIGRQIGAGGLGVAQLLSQEFGLKVYDKELLAAVARESGLDEACFEKRDEKSSRGVLGALQGFRSMLGMYNRAGTDTVMNEDKLFQIQSEVMRGIAAQEDCIIVGRCADYVLRDHKDLVSVFVHAPEEWRIENIKKRHPEDASNAEAVMRRTDKSRAWYYSFYTGKTWGAASSYDLCLRSDIITVDEAVSLILAFADAKAKQSEI